MLLHLRWSLLPPLSFPQEKYGLGTRLQRQRPGVPISSLSGLSWVAFVICVTTQYSHTNCCSIEYLCWHRWIDFLPGSSLWFINISMSRTSIYQTLEHVLTPSYWILRCHLYSSSLRHWASQWMHSRTRLNIRILIICWQSVMQTNHAVISRSKIEEVVRGTLTTLKFVV